MSRRIQRVNELIKREIGTILLREIEFPKVVLVTVSKVETSVDLHQVKVYISVMPESQVDKIIQILNRQIYHLQQMLNKRLKMRPVPRITFLEEKGIAEAGKIEEILEKIKDKD